MKLVSKKTAEKPQTEETAVPEVIEIAEEAGPVKQKQRRKPRRKGSKKWIFILALVAVAAVLLLQTIDRIRGAQDTGSSIYTYENPENRDITSVLTGSGTLEPADAYTVSTLVSGEILSAGFEEGDVIAKGDVLYQIDSSDKATTIERAELSLAQSERMYNNKASTWGDLTVTSPIGGTITGITVQRGETVSTQMAIATVEDVSSLWLTEYYSDEYSGVIYVGMPATVSIPDQMLNLDGTVKEITSLKRISETGVSCFGVTVEVTNVGALTSGMAATCWLKGSGGEEIYPSVSDDDGLDAKNRTKIYAGVVGTIAEIRVRNNETITAGQTIMLLSSDTLGDEILNAADSLRDAELSLQSQYDSLDNYTITAPIEGTIVDKYYKEGETTDGGRALCTIYDLSNLNFTMNVDELDISQTAVGQKAVITAQAVPGREYEGVITKVGINGTVGNGVTTYPVTVRIDKHDDLLPGMNVDVSIVVSNISNALSIPAAAVERGNRVLIKTADGSTGEGAPEGHKYVEVVTGVSDDDFVEIVAGIKSGDTIAYIPEEARGTSLIQAMYGSNGGAIQGGPMR